VSISPDVKLQTVLQLKENIRKATDEISQIISRLGKGDSIKATMRTLDRIDHSARNKKDEEEDPYYKLAERSSVVVRQKLHKIVSDLSSIAAFCDGKTKSYTVQISRVAAEITAKPEITNLEGFILESFCTMVNGIIVDYDKTPFRFSAEFKAGFDKFIAGIKTTYQRGTAPK
jgi:hypothetical protein